MLKYSRVVFILGLMLISFFSLILFKGIQQRKRDSLEERKEVLLDQRSVDLIRSVKLGKTKPKMGASRGVNQRFEVAWREFTRRFGGDLRPEVSPSGRLVSIQGTLGRGSRGLPGFHPEDSHQARARAEEIISAALGMLGIPAGAPLQSAAVTGSPVTAHVYFRQTIQGIPLEPVGYLKVDLGSQGELLALYSNLAGEVNLENGFVLTREQARESAFAKKGGLNSNPGMNLGTQYIRGGDPLIWVSGAHAYSAYRFFNQGREVIVSAQSGQVLLNRDRREYEYF